ncbi:MAG: tRNA (guanosine(37)-N1)-methyltransferase TrmD, partial [Candidatus Lightella neohaematopini]|nr:tRNA (guanosine(37)-N1)-methyltransferase TrmD [Candidatus Lightella neohaematopini]
NHDKINKWKLKQSLGRTFLRRPDLLNKITLSNEQKKLLLEFKQENNLIYYK